MLAELICLFPTPHGGAFVSVGHGSWKGIGQ